MYLQYFMGNYYIEIASYPGSPAFIRLEHKKKVTNDKKVLNTLKVGEPGISWSCA